MTPRTKDTKYPEDLPTMAENEWPIYAVLLKTGELYYHDPSLGNRHGCGEGWLMVLPWGEEHKRGFMRGDNRFGVEHEDVAAFTLLSGVENPEQAVRGLVEGMEKIANDYECCVKKLTSMPCGDCAKCVADKAIAPFSRREGE